ncbi:MAG: leucyl/phenylalanyl-tRNA--protein transferase [Spirochaeta sp.]
MSRKEGYSPIQGYVPLETDPVPPEHYYPMPLPVRAEGKEVWYSGGDLSPTALAAAYRQGFFPWEGDPLGWCSPDPRFVINPEDWHVSRSLKREIRRTHMEITVDADPHAVVQSCMEVARPSQPGTWLTAEMVEAYARFARYGYMHSAEAWDNETGELIGGLYGVLVGSIFVGDSMFSKSSGASKIVFAFFAEYLWSIGIKLIDCQVRTDYLAQFGAQDISRSRYMSMLSAALRDSCIIKPCRLHPVDVLQDI